jgi:WD40 repeat protein
MHLFISEAVLSNSENRPLLTINANNAGKLKQFHQIGRGRIGKIVWSADGEKLIVGSALGVWIYDANDLSVDPRFFVHPFPVVSVAVSPDNKILATACQGISDDYLTFIYLWDLSTGDIVDTLYGHERFVKCLSFSPDGSMLASGSRDSTIRLWDTTSWKEKTILDIENNGFTTDLAFSPDGQFLVSGNYYAKVHLWDVERGTLVRTFQHYDRLLAVDFSPDGKTLASISTVHRNIHLWHVDKDEPIRTLQHLVQIRPPRDFAYPVMPLAVKFSPDGLMLACVGVLNPGEDFDGLRLFDVNEGRELPGFYAPRVLHTVAFHPDGSKLAAANQTTLFLYDCKTRDEIARAEFHNSGINTMAVNSKHSTVAFSEDKTLKLYNYGERVQTAQIEIENLRSSPLRAIKFTNDGDHLLILPVNTMSKGLYVVDATTGQPTGREINLDIWCFDLSLDDRLLAVGCQERSRSTTPPFNDIPYTVRLWDLREYRQIAELEADDRGAHVVAISDDQRFLAAGGGYPRHPSEIRVWQTETGKLIHVLKEHQDYLRGLLFGSNSNQLVACSGYELFVWNLTTGECDVLVDNTFAITRTEQRWESDRSISTIEQVALTHKQEILAVGYYDGTLQLWDFPKRQLSYSMKGHAAPVTGLAFTKDDTMLVSSSADGTVRLWTVGEKS